MTALLLSPHLDDVAFSCGGTAARLARAGWRVVVATVFTRSVPAPQGFALACQLDKGLAAGVDYLAVRRAEDLLSVAALGAEAAHLDFAEAPHRGYESAAELFAGVRPGDDVWRPVADRLRALAAEVTPALVFAPQGLGNHADHLQLIAAALAVWPADWVTWYRDTPYAIRDPLARAAAGVPAGPGSAVDVTDTLGMKLDACAAFATQLGFQFGGPAGMRTSLSTFAQSEARAAGRSGAAERFAGAALELP